MNGAKFIAEYTMDLTYTEKCFGSVLVLRKGSTMRPQIMKPPKRMPLDLNVLAREKQIVAKNHFERAQYNIPDVG